MKDAIVTRDSLQHMIDTASTRKQTVIVGRALSVLLSRQTAAESINNTTTEANGIGFTGADAHSGSISAKVYIKTGMVKDWVLEKWLKKNSKGYSRITKYHRQLNEAAIEREEEFLNKIKGRH